MVRRAVGVFKRNAVEGHGVLAVGEAAEKGLALSETDSVRIDAERARRLLDHLGEIRDRGHEVLNHGAADFRPGIGRVERIALRRCLHRRQIRFLNCDRL